MIGKKIRQHNAITEARYEMSSLEKDLVYLLMQQIKEGDSSGKEYIIDTSHLDVSFKSLREAAVNLISRIYEIKKPSGDILRLTLMTVVKYNEDENKLQVKISQKLFPYLIAIRENYTEFELSLALDMKSKYAKRLYEMCSQHKEEGVFDVSLEELKWRLDLKNPNTREEKYPGWANFEKNVLLRPLEELNRKSDLIVSYVCRKDQKAYIVTFKIYPKPKQLLLDFRAASRRKKQGTVKVNPLTSQTKDKILLAEDIAFLASSYKNSLLRHYANVEVDIATNGLEVVEKVKKSMEEGLSPYRLIIMDIQMPQKNGVEASKAIRGLGYQQPIIAHTAMEKGQAIKATKKSEMNSLVLKADGVEKLLDEVRRFMEQE